MLDYGEWLDRYKNFNDAVNKASDAIQSYCTEDKIGNMGLVKDEYKFSEEYRTLRHNYNTAFSKLRWFNGLKNYKCYQKRRNLERRVERFKKLRGE